MVFEPGQGKISNMKWLNLFSLRSQETNEPALDEEVGSRLDEPERRLHDAREMAGVLDFLQRTQQTLIVNTPLSSDIFHFRLSEARHDSLLLHPANAESVWQSLTQTHDLLFNAMAPMGCVIWRVPIREKHSAYLVTARPKIMIRLQSRRHYRIIGLAHRSHNAKLVLNGATEGEQNQLSVDIDNLSEEGVAWTVDAKQFAQVYERGQVVKDSLLQLGGYSIRIAAIRIVRLDEAGIGKLKLGGQLHGLNEQDRRFLRRWLAEAEVKNAAR